MEGLQGGPTELADEAGMLAIRAPWHNHGSGEKSISENLVATTRQNLEKITGLLKSACRD